MSKTIYLYAFLLLTFCSCNSTQKSKEEKKESPTVARKEAPVEVKAFRTELQDFNYEIISNGIIAAQRKADLRFQNQEQISKIYVRNGQKVSKGQKLAELNKFKLENNLKQSYESFERARLDLQDVLIGQGYSLNDTTKISPEVLKIAKLRSNYEVCHNNYIMAKYNLDATTLYAPFSGLVANINMKEYNLPGNEPFCTIIDHLNPEVVFYVLESELPLLQLNNKVIVSPFSESTYSVEGKISEINPQIDKNGMVKVKAAINNKEEKFYEGMNVKVRVQRLFSKQLIVPKSAVVLRTNKKVIFTLKNRKAIWNYVETSQENSDSYVVTKGIHAGDSVIYDGNLNLAHGVSVKTVK